MAEDAQDLSDVSSANDQPANVATPAEGDTTTSLGNDNSVEETIRQY